MSPSRREVWSERIARYCDCSLTVKEFCRREGVSQPSFYQWKKELVGNSPATSPAFLPVAFESVSATPTTVRLPGGATIELPATISQEELQRIIAAVIGATNTGVAS